MAVCPFHSEKTPSLSIDPARGLFHCFGCGKSGDVFGWVQETQGLGFSDAVELLARRAGVTLTRDPEAAKHRDRRERLVDAVERAVRDQRKQKAVDEREAKKRVRRRMRFIRHILVYLVVISALLLIDALNGGGWWFFYIAALWGAVLAIQGMRFVTRRKGPLEQVMLEREAAPDQSRS
jgi:uncharacterized membrane protein